MKRTKYTWEINLYQVKRKQIVFTANYKFKTNDEITVQQMEKKIRKDFKSDLDKNWIFDFSRTK